MTSHRTTAELAAFEPELRLAPSEAGVLELVVRRPRAGEREVLDVGELTMAAGLVGDRWGARGRGNPDRQLTVMSARMVAFLAGDPQRRALAGDQLYVDLDLSHDNLPTGTRLAVGEAVIEVTAAPHRGCAKFVTRFGVDGMRFVNGRTGRALRLRGLNARVVGEGAVRPGDKVAKL